MISNFVLNRPNHLFYFNNLTRLKIHATAFPRAAPRITTLPISTGRREGKTFPKLLSKLLNSQAWTFLFLPSNRLLVFWLAVWNVNIFHLSAPQLVRRDLQSHYLLYLFFPEYSPHFLSDFQNKSQHCVTVCLSYFSPLLFRYRSSHPAVFFCSDPHQSLTQNWIERAAGGHVTRGAGFPPFF